MRSNATGEVQPGRYRAEAKTSVTEVRTSSKSLASQCRGERASRTSAPSLTLSSQFGQTRTVFILNGANTRLYLSFGHKFTGLAVGVALPRESVCISIELWQIHLDNGVGYVDPTGFNSVCRSSVTTTTPF